MALVTVQRSPSPSNSPELSESGDEVDHGKNILRQRRSSKLAFNRIKKLLNTVRFITKLRPHFSESYFAVKGAALILPRSEIALKPAQKSHGKGDIQNHLQSMFYLLRPEDTIKVAIKLESSYSGRNRYMAVVSTIGRQDTEESVILGIDCNEDVKIGLVLPIWADTKLRLDGDGGFSVFCMGKQHIFKPVSVQAMWSGIQALDKVVHLAASNNYITGRDGLSHTWVGYYESKIPSDPISITYLNEWHLMEDVDSQMGDRFVHLKSDENEQEVMKKKISTALKSVMMRVDLDEATSKSLRIGVEEELGRNLQEYKEFLDEEMIRILGQMDAPSPIFDYLYLGSEWNASNLEELFANKVGFILNVSREIDNFFSGMFKYMNVREYDRPTADLMKYWEETCLFISKARNQGSKVLVHCKMGISRSASTVIAYAMKEHNWSLKQAMEYVKDKRSIIKPNDGFLKQLETYEGILNASKKRHIFRTHSENILDHQHRSEEQTERPQFLGENLCPTDTVDDCQDMTEGEVLLRQTLGKTAMDKEGEVYCNIESDIEISSRSADSTENSLPDVASPKPASDPGISKHSGQAGIYIFPDRASVGVASLSNEVAGRKSEPLNFQFGPSGSESEDEETDDEEMEFENDDDDEERFFQPVRQSIDLSRLTESEDTKEAKRVIRRLSQPIDLIDKRLHVWRPQTVLMEQPVIPSSAENLPMSEDQSHVLGSDYSLMDFDHPSLQSNAEPSINSKLSVLSQNNNPVIIVDSPGTVQASCVQTQPVLSDSQSVQMSHYIEGNVDDAEAYDMPEIDQCHSDSAALSTPSKKKVEMGVRHHYIKEKIPWRVGTVRKKTQNLEEKIENDKTQVHKRTDSSGSSCIIAEQPCMLGEPSDALPDESVSSPCFAAVFENTALTKQEATPTIECQSVLDTETGTPPILSNSAIEITDDTEPLPQDRVPCNQIISSPMIMDDSSETKMETEVLEDEVQLRRPTSVYELEDIPLPAGIVKETTKAIEQRERLSSSHMSDETFKTKPVQRSSSLKSVRVTPKVKRNSERRKTCMPILSPSRVISDSPFDDVWRGSKSDGENDLEDMDIHSKHLTENQKVYKCGAEKVSLEAGIVRKHKEGFECLDFKAKEKPAVDSKALSSPFFIGDSSEDENTLETSVFFDKNSSSKLSKPVVRETITSDSIICDTSTATTLSSSQPTVPDFRVADNRSKVLSAVLDCSEYKLNMTPAQTPLSNLSPPKGQDVESVSNECPFTMSSSFKFPTELEQKPYHIETVSTPIDEGSNEIANIEMDNKKSVSEMIHEREAAVIASNLEKQVLRSKPESVKSTQSCFDAETLQLIRDIGSALLNSPPQSEKDVTEDPSNVVKHLVKNIESKSKKEEKHAGKEIVIIDKDSTERKPTAALPSPSAVQSEINSKSFTLSCDSQKPDVMYSDRFAHISRRCSEPVAQYVDKSCKLRRKEISLDETVKSVDGELASPMSDSDTTASASKCDRVKLMVGKFEPKDSSEATTSSDISSDKNLRPNPVVTVRPKSADNIFRNTHKPPFHMAKKTEAKRAALIRHHLSTSQQDSSTDFHQFSLEHRKVRKLHGKSHPLTKLEKSDYYSKRNSNPFYNTM